MVPLVVLRVVLVVILMVEQRQGKRKATFVSISVLPVDAA